MLARISGGNSGIAEYLETGIKNGRDFTRDELDQRVVLDGDLALTDQIINSMEDRGQERYLHITLSFRENNVSRETLQAVTQEYKSLLMPAYQDDEYSFYAEAHLPKIKQIQDRKTGKFVERKPHIHIIIPERNLLTGGYLSPLGRVSLHIKYHDAIQEHINNKYSLDSPKNFIRQGEEYHAEMLSRTKGDLFREKHGDLKRELLYQVERQNISNQEDFMALVSQYGETIVRNAGKENEYIAVKLDGDSKFTNLKAPVFKRAYIENRVLALDKPGPKQIVDRLDSWKHIVSREIKYIHNASAKVKAAYKAASLAERRTILDSKEHYHEQRYRASGRQTHHQSRVKQSGKIASSRLATGLPSLSKRDVVHRAWGKGQGAEGILRGHENRAMDNIGANQHSGLRRAGYESRAGTGIAQANLLVQLFDEVNEATTKENELKQFAEIRRNLNAEGLLKTLQERYAINPSNYRVSHAKDGSARINVGKENLNVSDFLTKHMNLKWAEAKVILAECYQVQQKEALPLSAKYTRRMDTGHWKDSWRQFAADKRAIYGTKMGRDERQAALSVAIFERLKREERIKDSIYGAILPAEAGKSESKTMVQEIDSLAAVSSKISIQENVERAQREQAFLAKAKERLRMNDLLADKSQKGTVVYKSIKDGSTAFTDQTDRIVFNKKDMDAAKIALGLELAVAKYGQSLKLAGSDEFKAKVIEVAAKQGINVELKPAHLQAMLVAKREELAQQQGNSAGEAEKGPQVADSISSSGAENHASTSTASQKREEAIAKVRSELDEQWKPATPDKAVSAGKDVPEAAQVAAKESANDAKSKEYAALELLQRSREVRNTGDNAQAKALLGEARAMAQALGKLEGQADKLPEAFKNESALKDSFHDGVKEWAKTLQKSRGMGM